MTANERMRVLQATDDYVEKYELILKEREEEKKFQATRHERFRTMMGIVDSLKDNLISAAYPRGGGDHLKEKDNVLGIKAKHVKDKRSEEQFTSFKSLLTKN